MSKMLELGLILSAIDKMSPTVRVATENVGSALAKIKGFGEGAATGLMRVESAAQRLLNASNKLRDASDNLSHKSLGLLGEGAVITGGLEKIMHVTTEFDTARTNLRVAMMDSTGAIAKEGSVLNGQFKEIDRIATNLGNRLPGTVADFHNAAAELLKNGTNAQTVLDGGLTGAAYTAVVMNLDPAEAAHAMAISREAFGLKDRELPQMGDVMQRSMYAFGMKPEEILAGLQYSASTMRTLHLTGMENAKMVMAMQGFARQQGMDGQVFGTHFKDALDYMAMMESRLGRNSKPMREVNEILKQHHIQLQMFNKGGQFVGYRQMLSELQKLRTLTDKDKIDVVNRLFGMQGGDAVMKLVQLGTDGLDKYLDMANRQASTAQRIDEITKSSANTWKALKGTIENVMDSIGEPAMHDWFIPVMNRGNQWASSIQRYFKGTDEVRENGKLVAPATAGHEGLAKLIVGSMTGVGGSLLAIGGLGLSAAFVGKMSSMALGGLGNVLRLFGAKSGRLGKFAEAAEAMGVQKVFVVNMPGAGLPGVSGSAGTSAFSGILGADGKPLARATERAVESSIKPIGRLGRAWAAIRGVPGAVLSRIPKPSIAGSVPGAARGILRRVPWLGLGLGAIDAASIAMSDATASAKKAAYAGIVGGTAGSAVGAMVGGALGSVIPVFGTAVGGMLGGMAGGWLGQKLGDYAGGKLFSQQAADHLGERVRQAVGGGDSKAIGKSDKAQQKPVELKVEYKPQIIIQGDPLPGTAQKFEAMLRQHQATLAKMIRDITAGQQRTSFGG